MYFGSVTKNIIINVITTKYINNCRYDNSWYN